MTGGSNEAAQLGLTSTASSVWGKRGRDRGGGACACLPLFAEEGRGCSLLRVLR